MSRNSSRTSKVNPHKAANEGGSFEYRRRNKRLSGGRANMLAQIIRGALGLYWHCAVGPFQKASSHFSNNDRK